MLQTTRHLLEMIRFSHTLFALPFALLAAMMAWHVQKIDATGPNASGFLIRWQELIGIVLCMVFARSAAMAFNRLVDRKFDAANPRTAGRHLPAGVLSVQQVTAFEAASLVAFMASTLLFLPNRLPLYLAMPGLAFLLGYSYAKRFTELSHFWLGAALAATPVAAWIAIRGHAVLDRPSDLAPPLVLAAAVLSWVAGFDMIYATQDFDFDRQAGLHSVPARWGVASGLRLAAACHLATIGFLAALPLVFPAFGWIWWAGVAAVAALLVYEHALVRPDDLARVNTAFFNVNAVISLGLLAVGTLDLMVN
jgi:4-hydroxybenzoate polyprenyltransferase